MSISVVSVFGGLSFVFLAACLFSVLLCETLRTFFLTVESSVLPPAAGQQDASAKLLIIIKGFHRAFGVWRGRPYKHFSVGTCHHGRLYSVTQFTENKSLLKNLKIQFWEMMWYFAILFPQFTFVEETKRFVHTDIWLPNFYLFFNF